MDKSTDVIDTPRQSDEDSSSVEEGINYFL